ncbi:hypothetical protein BDQ17DRAFT_1459564 [Cyathus striatus]|nr:hypothetical protein BDQ17DRAFT_1459564 [Cyathus striatus]
MAASDSDNRTKASVPDSVIFDVDQRTGFMASEEPLTRLPEPWEPWESTLDAAVDARLQLGDKPGITAEDIDRSSVWRVRVRELPFLSVEGLDTPILLRRAHVVLTYLLHFYVQSLPPHDEVRIPRSISIPTVQISTKLDIPPLLTFSDTVLYNWTYRQAGELTPTPSNIRYLDTMAHVINELRVLLLDVKKLCDPNKYYTEVRPWFRGEDSDINHRKWVYEGIDDYPELKTPTELSGPSAGQSSIVHVLDLFLGVDHQPVTSDQPSFMSRMKLLFLDHLASNPRPLREFALASGSTDLMVAYNHAVLSLKAFRDSHMIIVTLRAARTAPTAEQVPSYESLKGTGGTDLVEFLKGTRDCTKDTLIN